jgi:stage II sporulation protein D
VPSNAFDASREGNLLVLHGRGAGHGIGLCQLGAAQRAAAGATFVEILAAYYPNTTLSSLRPDPVRLGR